MKTEFYFSIIVCLCFFSLLGCKTFHLGVGTSYNNGNSGGCDDKNGVGFQIETTYHFGMENGPGIALDFFTPGYSDCNDGDPLLFLIPQLKYRHFLTEEKLAIDVGAGYAMGAFIDPGYQLSGGVNLYAVGRFYIHLEQNYYQAFNSKENAIMPGTSSNSST